ncbi:phage major capsid protein [Fusobacterium ulcerans]|jgi:HK97 family phage major capsid protein|uniref:phage major capsid protein n=1 Tax=Fusobacterium ulcerans TaxID=861 RepID=UPI002E78297F|nr:phage major capsid protein [Fusobacterium ulcerans]MEE0136826.1 phage major capsid protein [Fusobacterium ulcerans]
MNILELQEKSLELRKQLAEVIATGQKEERELTENENNSILELRNAIDEINAQIETIEAENRTIEKENNTEKKEIRTMSLVKLINTVIEGRNFSEDEAKAIAEARADFAKSGLSPKGQIVYRSIAATVDGAGKENVAEDKWNLEVAVRNNLIATKMGADFVGGLVGDVSIPQYGGSTVKWKGETATADDGQGAFTEVTLAPKRLTATLDVSKQFLLQDSNDAEAILIRDLAAAVAEKLDKTIFSAEEGDVNTPAGIFAGVGAEKAIADMTYDDVLALEEAVELANGTNYMFVVNPKVKFALKGTQMANGLQMVFDGKEIDGFTTISSNSVVDKGIVCMDPRELVIGQWGAYDITVDPYTKAADGQVRLVINAYFDAKLRGNKVAKAIFN